MYMTRTRSRDKTPDSNFFLFFLLTDVDLLRYGIVGRAGKITGSFEAPAAKIDIELEVRGIAAVPAVEDEFLRFFLILSGSGKLKEAVFSPRGLESEIRLCYDVASHVPEKHGGADVHPYGGGAGFAQYILANGSVAAYTAAAKGHAESIFNTADKYHFFLQYNRCGFVGTIITTFCVSFNTERPIAVK